MIFSQDKTALLAYLLDRVSCVYRRSHVGWQPVRCINTDAHARGDQHPSASVNLTKGRYNCHACGLRGDPYDVAQELLGWDARALNEAAEVEPGKEESEWII